MGTTYFVDSGSASEASPYDTWAKAAHTLATVLAIPPAAGDVIYCNANNGETIAAELGLASSGTYDGGMIRLIGCKPNGASGVTIDGTRYTINGGGNGINILNLAGFDMWWFENIRVTNTGAGAKYGFTSGSANADGHVFVNCCSDNTSGIGFNGSSIRVSKFIRCVSHTHTYDGFSMGGLNNHMLFCCSRDNSRYGYNIGYADTMNGCISYHNTSDGVYPTAGALIMNCVLDSNDAYNINVVAGTNAYQTTLIANRITDTLGSHVTAGVDCNDRVVIMGWNYFDESLVDGDAIIADGVARLIYVDSATLGKAGGGDTDSNLYEQDDDNQGYVDDDATPDFSTQYVSATDPVLRRVAVTVPWE